MNRYTKLESTLPRVDVDGSEHWVEYIEISDKKGAEQKLFQLENIEEELGIDLLIIVRAISDGIYINTNLGIEHLKGKFLQYDKEEKTILAFLSPHPCELLLKDYGDTWALTKEELE